MIGTWMRLYMPACYRAQLPWHDVRWNYFLGSHVKSYAWNHNEHAFVACFRYSPACKSRLQKPCRVIWFSIIFGILLLFRRVARLPLECDWRHAVLRVFLLYLLAYKRTWVFLPSLSPSDSKKFTLFLSRRLEHILIFENGQKQQGSTRGCSSNPTKPSRCRCCQERCFGKSL
jgi:hypothetical protein